MRKNEDEINAHRIHILLTDWGILSIEEIREFTNSNIISMYFYLGWLLITNKIRFVKKGQTVCVELIRSIKK